MTKAVRQGDVLIVPCKNIPKSAAPVKAEYGRLVVARGEATGHHHSFPHLRGAVLFRDDAAGSGIYLRVEKPVALEHQEHSALIVEPGDYKISIQRTMSSGLVRRVQD